MNFGDYSYLYVEDDPMSRQVMRLILCETMKAKHLVMLEDSQGFADHMARLIAIPDVILLDIHVLPLNGFEMLRVLRSLPQFARTRIIALTASVMNEEVDQLREAGFDGAIAKPLSIHTFPELMTRILQGETVWHIM